MKKILVAFVWLSCCSVFQAQTLSLTLKASLPAVIGESSGVEVSDRNHIWSHNDSGGNAELFEFDSTGVLLRSLQIQNASNQDWEEMARDSAGNIFIGDFGNNNNNRTNLVIYKIQNPDSVAGSSVASQQIHFTYPDQYAFPPAATLQNFDMEAMFWFNHSIYLFSKNRTTPYTGYSKLYRLPDTAGTYIATLVDSFYTGAGPYYLTSITSADISPDGQSVALLCGVNVFLFTSFTGDDFFGGTLQQFSFASLTQKEAIVFISNHELYITDEKTDANTGNLYYAELGTPVITEIFPADEQDECALFPNPNRSGNFQLRISEKFTDSELRIINSLGEVVYLSQVSCPSSSFNADLPAGIYLLQIGSKAGITKRFVKM